MDKNKVGGPIVGSSSSTDKFGRGVGTRIDHIRLGICESKILTSTQVLELEL